MQHHSTTPVAVLDPENTRTRRRSNVVKLQPESLADQINEEHQQASLAYQSAVRHAIESGRLLVKAKAEAEHGAWASWVAKNCSLTIRTASTYMTLYRDRKDIADSTSLTEAMQAIRIKRQFERGPKKREQG